MNVKIYEDDKLVYESDPDTDNRRIEIEQRAAYYVIDGVAYSRQIRVAFGGDKLSIQPITPNEVLVGPE